MGFQLEDIIEKKEHGVLHGIQREIDLYKGKLQMDNHRNIGTSSDTYYLI